MKPCAHPRVQATAAQRDALQRDVAASASESHTAAARFAAFARAHAEGLAASSVSARCDASIVPGCLCVLTRGNRAAGARARHGSSGGRGGGAHGGGAYGGTVCGHLPRMAHRRRRQSRVLPVAARRAWTSAPCAWMHGARTHVSPAATSAPARIAAGVLWVSRAPCAANSWLAWPRFLIDVSACSAHVAVVISRLCCSFPHKDKGQHALACTRGSAHKREASGCATIPPASQVYFVFVFLFPKTTGCAQLHARLGSSAGRCVRLAGQGSRASFFMESAPSALMMSSVTSALARGLGANPGYYFSHHSASNTFPHHHHHTVRLTQRHTHNSNNVSDSVCGC